MKKTIALMVGLLICGTGTVMAEALPSSSGQVTVIATVCDQAEITVPANVYFQVDDISIATDAADNTVSATSIVLGDGEAMRVEIQADAADFSMPTGASVSWAATDVSWNAAVWTGGTGISGSLSSVAYTKVAESNANVAELSTAALTFTLAANGSVDHAGDYDLSATWRFTNFTP